MTRLQQGKKIEQNDKQVVKSLYETNNSSHPRNVINVSLC
jgi:hypothetical protein